MKTLKNIFAVMVCSALTLGAQAQQVQGFVHQQSKSTDYVWPTDKQVLDKLDHWQDKKFGVLFHWGLYSVPVLWNPGLSVPRTWIGFRARKNCHTMNTRNGISA